MQSSNSTQTKQHQGSNILRFLDLLNRPTDAVSELAADTQLTNEDERRLEAFLFACRRALEERDGISRVRVEKRYIEQKRTWGVAVDGQHLAAYKQAWSLLDELKALEKGLDSLDETTDKKTPAGRGVVRAVEAAESTDEGVALAFGTNYEDPALRDIRPGSRLVQYRDGQHVAELTVHLLRERRRKRRICPLISVDLDGLSPGACAVLAEWRDRWTRLWAKGRIVRRCQYRKCAVVNGRWFIVQKRAPRAIDCPFCRRARSKQTRWRGRFRGSVND